jgi:hypothetical protein
MIVLRLKNWKRFVSQSRNVRPNELRIDAAEGMDAYREARAGIQDSGPIGEAGRMRLRGLIPAIACQTWPLPGNSVAKVIYRMLKYRIEYDPLSVNEYQKQYEEQQIKYMKKRAAKLGYELLSVAA